MSKANLIFDVMQQELQRKKRHLSRSYAHGLATLLHIDPHGKHLITLLGEGHESSNLEAITNWVHQQLERSLELKMPSESAMTEFRRSLINELMDFQA